MDTDRYTGMDTTIAIYVTLRKSAAGVTASKLYTRIMQGSDICQWKKIFTAVTHYLKRDCQNMLF
jgi:hypothetical protein